MSNRFQLFGCYRFPVNSGAPKTIETNLRLSVIVELLGLAPRILRLKGVGNNYYATVPRSKFLYRRVLSKEKVQVKAVCSISIFRCFVPRLNEEFQLLNFSTEFNYLRRPLT